MAAKYSFLSQNGRFLAVVVLAFIAFSIQSTASPIAKKDKKVKYTVYVFMSETCPICQYHILDLKKFQEQYEKQGFKFVLVFPNALSSKKTIKKFMKEYEFEMDYILDSKQQMVRRYRAEVTPEVYIEGKSSEKIYNGRIDNTFERIGVRRTVTTSFDLRDILEQLNRGDEKGILHTEPVGCLITPRK
jgi:peroxiredoxin